VYVLTCVRNGKQYVGITSRTSSFRWMKHCGDASAERTVLARAIMKYGKDAFQLEHVATACTWQAACEIERLLIRERNTRVPAGYNMTDGGDGTLGAVRSSTWLERVSASNTGKRHSDETCRKLSEMRKGKPYTGRRPTPIKWDGVSKPVNGNVREDGRIWYQAGWRTQSQIQQRNENSKRKAAHMTEQQKERRRQLDRDRHRRRARSRV
jgi:group I intron endonuclease